MLPHQHEEPPIGSTQQRESLRALFDDFQGVQNLVDESLPETGCALLLPASGFLDFPYCRRPNNERPRHRNKPASRWCTAGSSCSGPRLSSGSSCSRWATSESHALSHSEAEADSPGATLARSSAAS